MPRLMLASASRPAWPATLTRLAQTVQHVWNTFQRERRLTATIHTLDGLSDRTLRDIGLERHNIADVVRDRCRDG